MPPVDADGPRSPGSKTRLRPGAQRHYPSDSAFDRIARVVCRVGLLPRKELYESWEIAKRVRRHLRGTRIVDLACGHGLLAYMLGVIVPSVPEVLAVDRRLPPSEVHHAIEAGAEGAFVAIGHCGARERIAPLRLDAGLELIDVQAPSGYVARSAKLGRGVIVGANAVVSSGAVVGDLSLALSQTVLGHHSRLGTAVMLSGGSMLAGRVHVGDRTVVGLGARVLPDVSIGADAIIGAGAVVTKDVPDGVRVAGVPARPVEASGRG